MSAAEDEFLLKWHDHHQSFFLLVEELVMREQLTDVTLACGGNTEADQQLLSAHSLMLSVCSPYFRSLLSENRHKEKHHIIHLHGVSSRHMQQLLLYMYRGEISISQEDLAPLIETAKCLQIKGLAMAQTNMASPTPGKKRAMSQSPGSDTSPSSSSSSFQVNKNKKSKTKHRSNSPITDEPVVPSQDFSTETIKGEIPEEININIGENKPELVPDIPENIFGHKGIGLLNTISSTVVRILDNLIIIVHDSGKLIILNILQSNECFLELAPATKAPLNTKDGRDPHILVQTDLAW